MSDRFLKFANRPYAATLVRALGLPQPKPLPRRTGPYLSQEHAGRQVVLLAAPGGFAEAPCRTHLSAGGADLSPAGTLHALVVDATGCVTAAGLDYLHDMLRSVAGRLKVGGRVVLLARQSPKYPEVAAAARGVEGFTRALGKELGRRGATANCIYLSPDSLEGLPAMLDFFATDRSAYVCGQAMKVGSNTPAAAPSKHDKVAVVTGAAGGIGAATARRLAAEGMQVVCVDTPRVLPALAELAAEINGIALPLDITTEEAGSQLLATVVPLGGVDVLVHNAGITRDRTFMRMSAAEWGAVFSVNLGAVLRLDLALDDAGALRQGAREICLASISGIAGNAGQTNYSAAKAALIGYAAARAQALRASGVTVNAVAPGFIETSMTRSIPFMVREVGRRLNSLAQGGHPEDVAEAIAFLARPQAQAITGQTLRVCGQSFLGA